MHRISAKAGLIPEEHLPTLCLGLSRNGRIGLAPPSLDRRRISLIRPLQRLLRCQIELGEQRANCGETEADAKLPLDQLGHHRTCP